MDLSRYKATLPLNSESGLKSIPDACWCTPDVAMDSLDSLSVRMFPWLRVLCFGFCIALVSHPVVPSCFPFPSFLPGHAALPSSLSPRLSPAVTHSLAHLVCLSFIFMLPHSLCVGLSSIITCASSPRPVWVCSTSVLLLCCCCLYVCFFNVSRLCPDCSIVPVCSVGTTCVFSPVCLLCLPVVSGPVLHHHFCLSLVKPTCLPVLS